MKKILFFSIIATFVFFGCEPVEAPDIDLGTPPSTPEFAIDFLDSNTVIVTDLSSGNFTRVWDFGSNADGDFPIKKTSTNIVDTVAYPKKGEYTITLYVSSSSGGGTAQSSQTINIEKDGEVGCNPTLALLTGDCLPAGKCWTFTQAAGAVKIGPNIGDWSWFTSPAGGLQAEQYDDSFCFYVDNTSFVYNNNGETVDPFNGFTPVAYTPPTGQSWTYSPGTGNSGRDQIILSEGSFLGLWNVDEVYDIVSITETELVVHVKEINQDGTLAAGWFELVFEAQ